VALRRDGPDLVVRVADDGAARSGGSESLAARRRSAGYGIAGMHERVHLAGGTVHAGPGAAEGGWLVEARLPVSGSAR
jgi:signal transduction histidine kinase